MLSRKEIVDIWREEYGELPCPFLTHEDTTPSHTGEKRVMWFVDMVNMNMFAVDAFITEQEEVVWVPSLGNRYITETVIFSYKEQAAALLYKILTTEFRRLVEIKERVDAIMKE
jgi:hypothetical protein